MNQEANRAIADLDAELARIGQTVTLQRMTLGPNNTQVPFDCDAKARVRDYAPAELVGAIIQGDSHVILSPSPLSRAQWPGPGADPLPAHGDRIVINGRTRNVQAAVPLKVGDTIVRIELQVRG